MRISKSIVITFLICLGALLAYGWMDTGVAARDNSGRQVITGAFPIPVTTPKLQTYLQQFTGDVKNAVLTEAIPGLALAVVYDGRVVLSAGFGVTDLEAPSPVRAGTVFRVASLSKGFAPVLTGMLVDEGRLSWDDPVIKYLPDFRLKSPEATRKLTIRHLLNHTSGLPRHAYSNLLNQDVPYRKIIPMLARVTLSHEPGSYYNYQNVAYSLIGEVLEKAAGLSYDSLLIQRIFRPLDMADASVGYEKMKQTPLAAQPHGPDAAGYHRLEFRDKWYDVRPAAGVNASVEDLARWLNLMMGLHPELISAESLQEITRKQVEVSPMENVMRAWRPMEAGGYGLGWRTLKKDGRRIVFHGGFVNGYRAEIGFSPEEKLGIVVLCNGANHFMRDALPNFFSGYFSRLDLQHEPTVQISSGK